MSSERRTRGGSYAIHGEIGAGGRSTVHLGQLVGARGFSKSVAIKVLPSSYARNKAFVARFLDEARLVGRIHHPNVMPMLDVLAEGDDLRIVMDYVAGEALDQIEAQLHARARGERIPVPIAVAVIVGVLHGLHAAHEAKNEFGEPLGIVHLDVSPQNILVGIDGTARVLDFGVARAFGECGEPPRATITGKSAYLAPEQVRGAEVSPRTDVFAAAIVLWEMLTGEPLFASDNHGATMQRVLACVIPSTADRVPNLPAGLDEVLAKGLKRDPAQRFATARDMALALEQTALPALPSEVGRWVGEVAEAALLARAAKVREMESSADARPRQMPELVSPRSMYDEQAAMNLDAPDGLVPQREKDGSIRWKKPPATLASATSLPVGEANAVHSGFAQRSHSVQPAAPSPPAVREPSRASPTSPPPTSPSLDFSASTRVDGAEAAPAGHSRTRGDGADTGQLRPSAWALRAGLIALAALGLVAALLAGRSLFLPTYVTHAAVTTAASHGVTLTVESASLSERGVLLRGITVSLVGVPHLTCAVSTADVRVAWSSPISVVLGTTEVAVDGDLSDVLGALEAWSAGPGRPARQEELPGGQIDVPSAHLVWTHAGGADTETRLEARGLKATVGSAASVSLADDLHFLTNALMIETRAGPFGPWGLSVDETLKGTRARVAFDPAVPDGPNALLVDDAAGNVSFDVSVSRQPTSSLGVPRTALGPDMPLPQQLEVSAHYGKLGPDAASGSLRAAFFGLKVPELGTTVDAQLSGEAAGASTMAVRNGVFVLGPVHGTVTGSITPPSAAAGRSVRAALAWRGEPVACASLVALPTPADAVRTLTRKASEGDLGDLGELARDFGALGHAVGAVKVTGAFAASGTVALDSASLARTKFATVAKNACGISLFQSK